MHKPRVEGPMLPAATKLPAEAHRIIAREALERGVTMSARIRDILVDYARWSAMSTGYPRQVRQCVRDSVPQGGDAEDRHGALDEPQDGAEGDDGAVYGHADDCREAADGEHEGQGGRTSISSAKGGRRDSHP